MFMQRCVVGGRVMTANNEKIIIQESDNCSVDDFDAVSLYPSAMERLPGFIKGKPKVIKELTMDFLKMCDTYFVEIKITNVGIKRAFPLTSYKTSKGVRFFTNDCIGKHVHGSF